MDKVNGSEVVREEESVRAGKRPGPEGGLDRLSSRLDEMELAIYNPSSRKGTCRANEIKDDNYYRAFRLPVCAAG